jgi:hypothetical protein
MNFPSSFVLIDLKRAISRSSLDIDRKFSTINIGMYKVDEDRLVSSKGCSSIKVTSMDLELNSLT